MEEGLLLDFLVEHMIQIDGYASSDTGKEYRGQMLNVEEQPQQRCYHGDITESQVLQQSHRLNWELQRR